MPAFDGIKWDRACPATGKDATVEPQATVVVNGRTSLLYTGEQIMYLLSVIQELQDSLRSAYADRDFHEDAKVKAAAETEAANARIGQLEDQLEAVQESKRQELLEAISDTIDRHGRPGPSSSTT